MSHFAIVKTIIRDRIILCEALRDLHYTFREGENLTIRGYSGQRENAQVVVDTGSAYDIGFQRQADTAYAVCADWWGVERNSGIRQDTFLREINQAYVHKSVRKRALEMGYLIEEDRVLENNEIELVVCEPL